MARIRHSAEQIINKLREAEVLLGTLVGGVSRQPHRLSPKVRPWDAEMPSFDVLSDFPAENFASKHVK